MGKTISWIALAATILPSVLFFLGAMGHETVKWATLVATLVWFGSTSSWMGKPSPIEVDEPVI